jgi:hypothetical protein
VDMVGVNTPTSSVRNTVVSKEVETLPEGWNIEDEREEPSTKPQPHSLPETLARIGLVPLRENQQPATVVGIWGLEGNAGIGQYSDGVGPKKPKTGDCQQPSSLFSLTMRGGGLESS